MEILKFDAQSTRVIELVKELKDSESRSRFWTLVAINQLEKVN